VAVRLQVTVRPALVQPGAVAHVAISYVEDALVQGTVFFPRQPPVWLYDTTDSHGHARLALRVPRRVVLDHGHAVAVLIVRAMAGPWQRVARLAPVVRPGSTARLLVSAAPLTWIRALVTGPGMRPLRLFALTDGHGHLQLRIRVPRQLRVQHGHAVLQVAITALRARRSAVTARVVHVSDLLLSVVGSPIVHCVQIQTVRVAYRPSTRVRIRLLFPHQPPLTLSVRTDRQGTAALRVQVTYQAAPNPVHIGVEALAATGRPPRLERLERVGLVVRVPRACQAPTPAPAPARRA
jgi:hypothetical protein